MKEVGIRSPLVVAGYKSEILEKALSGIRIVRQKEALGSAHAVSVALKAMRRHPKDTLIVCCDTPLIKAESIRRLIEHRRASDASAVLLTAMVDNPSGYGRVIKTRHGEVMKIVEEIDALPEERAIGEINVGAYCFKTADLIWALKRIDPDNKKKEYYLTDAIGLLHAQKKRIGSVMASSSDEALGINSRSDLAEAIHLKRTEILKDLMASGVTIIDPATTFIDSDVTIGMDSVVYPGTIIERGTRIGKRCRIGPFARVRKNVTLGNNVEIGNFVELVRTAVGDNSKIKHLSYLGDAVVGKNVNIGAGFITANFDGKNKNRTIIEDGSFLGVGSILIAPSRVGRRSTVGAGCVVTKNFRVPRGTTVVGIPARVLKRK